MTQCFTYKVKMLIQVLAESQEQADALCDQQGGFLTARTVELISRTELPSVGLEGEGDQE